MKDIDVLLLEYVNLSALEKSLMSLRLINHRLMGVIAFEEKNFSSNKKLPTVGFQVQYKKVDQGLMERTLHQYVQKSTSNYVLLLYDQDYLTPDIKNIPLYLSHSQSVLTHPYRIQNVTIQRPLLVKTSSLQKKNFLSKQQVPFKEAIIPSWLMHFNSSEVTTLKRNVIKQTRKTTHANALQKQHLLKKYNVQPELSLPTMPSVAVMISNYNMAQYVDTAITSCVWQKRSAEQILIIDDGSTDGSYHQLEKWKDIPEIQLIHKENGGKARALNELLPYVEADFVVELDADDWLDPDAVTIIKQYSSLLSDDSAVLYGNLKTWKQTHSGDMQFKGIHKGKSVHTKHELLSCRFPLGPRIYRTSSLKENGGFPVIDFQNGRLFEDVSILNDLIKIGTLQYRDFTVYNVREHDASITKKNHSKWNDFIKSLD